MKEQTLIKNNYAKSVLREVIKELATGEKDVRKRICSNDVIFEKLKEQDFPEALREEWKWIIQNVKMKEPRYLSNGKMIRSNIENTMDDIRNSTASKIAERIFEIYFKLLEY